MCVSAPESQHEASVRFITVLVWYLSHHFSRSLRRQQCQDIVERSRPLVNNVPSIVPTKHVSANSQSLCSSSAPLKAIGLFSLATSFAFVTVLTAPTRWTVSLSPPAFVLASSLLWMFRLQRKRFRARFQLAAQHERVINSAPLPCKVRQVSHVCCARCDGK